ncbi:MAG: hypothetical protein EBQ54_00625, partial [Actinobacteria bacterium]|nr:hypothetical protein [Actinomycetota bacterium]
LSESATIFLTLPEQELQTERWSEVAKLLNGSVSEVFGYKYTAVSKTAGYQLGAALTYRHRKRSESYQVRILESLFGGFDLPIKKLSRKSIGILIKNRSTFLKRLAHEFPAIVRGTKGFFWIWSKFVSRKISAGCEISHVLEICKPNATITLMQRQAAFVIASLDAGTKYEIPTLLIPYKWDNASSKSPLIRTPNRLLVYNGAIKNVCARLHEMPVDNVVAVGSVEISKGKFCDLSENSSVIPLIGATIDTKSAQPWLIKIDEVAKKSSISAEKQKYRLIWRPYPTADKANLDFMHEFVAMYPQIELDQDIAEAASHRSSKLSFQDTKSAYFRYISLLESALFVVSEGTSVIVDARARGLAVIYPAFKRNAVVGSQWHRLNTSNHLKGLRETSGVFIAEDEQELERLLVDFLTNPR